MSRRLAFSALGAFVVLISMMPVHAVPSLLQCRASGTAVHIPYGGTGPMERWTNIDVSGRCLGDPAGPLDVTVTGQGTTGFTGFSFLTSGGPDVLLLQMDLRLSDSTGKRRWIQQRWDGVWISSPCDQARVIIRRRGLPVGGNNPIGFGRLVLCYTDPSDPATYPVSTTFNFVAPAW